MYILIFFVILAVLVLVHEFGHFYAAKKCGVRVDEFGLGFPPRLWSKKVGETVYSVNWIPFGGFVKIFGETPDDEALNGADKARSFVNISRPKQVLVLAAGIVMNVLFAWLLFSFAYMSGMTTGVSEANSAYITDRHVIVLDALPGSAAEKAGLKQGDEILSYSMAGAAAKPVNDTATVQDLTRTSSGKPIQFEVLRAAAKQQVTVTPTRATPTSNYAIGISMDLVGKVNLPIHKALWEGAKLAGNVFVSIFVGLYDLLHDAILGKADVSQLSGPVGIARLVGDASKLGFVYLLSFTGFISLNLAALNLIPFPALDGGRILFVIIEAIRRKAIKPQVANIVNAAGFCILIAFMLFITYKDIVKLV